MRKILRDGAANSLRRSIAGYDIAMGRNRDGLIDKKIGAVVRTRRVKSGMSQGELGRAVGGELPTDPKIRAGRQLHCFGTSGPPLLVAMPLITCSASANPTREILDEERDLR